MNVRLWLLIILCAVLAGALRLRAQQKGQYMPGQHGRADIQVGDAFMTPTGRNSPGALKQYRFGLLRESGNNGRDAFGTRMNCDFWFT